MSHDGSSGLELCLNHKVRDTAFDMILHLPASTNKTIKFMLLIPWQAGNLHSDDTLVGHK